MKTLKEKQPINKQTTKPKTAKKEKKDFDLSKALGAWKGQIVVKPGCWDCDDLKTTDQ